MNKTCILMVGPPGSGKSTLSKKLYSEYVYVNQDSQGPEHFDVFDQAILADLSIVTDRMNFNKEQRKRYLKIAKEAGYETEIVVIHESYETCYNRILKREGHETIKDEKARRGALNTFFTKYEPVTDDEADKVTRLWPLDVKDVAIWSDIDGTVANVEHRRHFVRGEKRDWKGFFKEMVNDTPNLPVIEVLERFSDTYPIVYCSGRPENYKKETQEWLDKHCPNGKLFMRNRSDMRSDTIVKQIILDFEILTRHKLLFCLDDRDIVVKMLRDRGQTVFQVASGDF